jgi:hypothetical protein
VTSIDWTKPVTVPSGPLNELLDAVETLLDHPEETSPLDDGWLREAYRRVTGTLRAVVENGTAPQGNDG